MKQVKIIIAVTVISIIGFFVWKSFVKIDDIGKVPSTKNQFIARIESETNSLNKSPKNVFCHKLYKDIQYLITDYYKQGFLGKTDFDNKQWRDILTKNLYSTYAPKFAEQAMNVFNGSEWRIADLNLISSEIQLLQNSSYLEQSSIVASSFKSIRVILTKYYEIENFIYSCNNFTYPYSYTGDRFPDVSDKIKKSLVYLNNNLDNSYVNNCTRLKDGLREIPQNMFNIHISYLRTKIKQNGHRYQEFQSQSDYSDVVYKPIRNQVESLSNSIYGINDNTFNDGYISLDNLLTYYNRQATDYFHRLNNK